MKESADYLRWQSQQREKGGRLFEWECADGKAGRPLSTVPMQPPHWSLQYTVITLFSLRNKCGQANRRHRLFHNACTLLHLAAHAAAYRLKQRAATLRLRRKPCADMVPITSSHCCHHERGLVHLRHLRLWEDIVHAAGCQDGGVRGHRPSASCREEPHGSWWRSW